MHKSVKKKKSAKTKRKFKDRKQSKKMNRKQKKSKSKSKSGGYNKCSDCKLSSPFKDYIENLKNDLDL